MFVIGFFLMYALVSTYYIVRYGYKSTIRKKIDFGYNGITRMKEELYGAGRTWLYWLCLGLYAFFGIVSTALIVVGILQLEQGM